MQLTIENIIKAANGKLLHDSAELGRVSSISGISIDTRTIKQNEVFIAIQGKIHDGHSFINEAAKKGAKIFIVNERFKENISIKTNSYFIGVKDTTKALGDIANFQRKKSNVKLAAITGSSGKTTTKNMILSVLKQKFNALSNKGNFNNEIGVSLTLLNLDFAHKWAVAELGINNIGEMARLAEISEPDIGVILNIGHAHIEGLGSIEGVAKEKGELIKNIKSEGAAVLNADDPFAYELYKKASCNIIFFGTSDKADIKASDIKRENMKISFTLITPLGRILINLPVCGSFMVSNALAAACIGFLAGLSNEDIKKGLENFTQADGRMNIIKKHRVNIIDDTYNANPDSLSAAVNEFERFKGKKFLALGDMLELGENSEKYHKNIGILIGKKDLAGIFITGSFKENVRKGALQSGFTDKNIFCGTKEEIAVKLNDVLEPNDWILIKGSRAMAMEDIINKLKEK
jgi:UDP-N-acetylmuramoyl-tripeptide--D-alanyl-D-alanine ligase